MKLSRFLLVTFFFTGFSLLYVYQQTEIVRLAYAGQKKVADFQDLLDRNSFLRYNMEKSASLTRVGNKISGGVSIYEMPDTYKLVRLNKPLENLRLSKHTYKQESLLSRLFGIKRQAEAKTISP
ncbi:MAG: hypothetical protein WAW67_07595 [Candidatus Omnitrophota bacterium]